MFKKDRVATETPPVAYMGEKKGMEVEEVLCMKEGNGEYSYANNSSYQRTIILMSKHIVEKAIRELYCTTFPKTFTLADLGCSSGPNTFTVISQIIDAIASVCRHVNGPAPALQVYLNDLPTNDFNSIFKSLPSFIDKHKKKEKGINIGPCYVFGAPGSFHGRLFPDQTLHFIHSSYSVHWLSQVPPLLQSGDGIGLNQGHIYIAETSPPFVHQVYLEQFEKDFSLFLMSRSQELLPKGRMVLTFMGRTDPNPTSGIDYSWELLAQALNDMVSEGMIDKVKMDSFNMPFYFPSVQELGTVIEKEGSFHVNKLKVIETDWDADHAGNELDGTTAKHIAKRVRAISESLLASHFGEIAFEDLFERFVEKTVEHLSNEKRKTTSLVISMAKKG